MAQERFDVLSEQFPVKGPQGVDGDIDTGSTEFTLRDEVIEPALKLLSLDQIRRAMMGSWREILIYVISYKLLTVIN